MLLVMVCARADVMTMAEVEVMDDAVAVAKEDVMVIKVVTDTAVGEAVAMVEDEDKDGRVRGW